MSHGNWKLKQEQLKTLNIRTIEEAFLVSGEGKIYRSVINQTEKLLIEKVLQKTAGNQILAAQMLGLNRNTLRSKIRKLQIDPLMFREYKEDY